MTDLELVAVAVEGTLSGYEAVPAELRDARKLPTSKGVIPDPAPGEPSPGTPDRRLDDIGNASRFVDEHGDALRYVPAWKQWLAHDGRRWAEDELLEPLRRAKLTARALVHEADREPDDQTRRLLLKHAASSASEPRLRAMLKLASERLALRPRDLDGDPYALNSESGVVDLRTGQLTPHRPGDHLTMLAGARYDPKATCPVWDSHLRRCLVTDELIEFLPRLAGAAAVGTSREQRLAILYGSGANGKTVTRNAIARALGDYAHQSSLDLLMQSGRSVGQATPELADLRGRRFVTVSETPEDGRLAAERVKAITGSEPITARRLHGNPFTFDPSHSVWLLTNHLPRIADDGHAIWRRVLVIPFTVTIPEAEQDRDLGDKLAGERAGILRWIVEGAVAYLRDGLNEPDIVKAATRKYRENEDTFSGFLADRCLAEPDASEAAADLRRAYNEWADQNGAPTISGNALAEKLNARGYERRRPKTGTRWHGLRLTREGTLDDV